MKADSITFQLNTRYIHIVAYQILSDVKNLPLPLPEMEKKNSLKSLDKKIFRTKLRSFLY